MEIIKIENLSFSYPSEKKTAISNISLEIEKGQFITLSGKSGCGKSTLLRQLKPILSPHGQRQGNIYFEKRKIEELSQKEQAEKIGFVLQNPDNQIVTDKVWHELAFGLESLSYSETEIRTRVSEMACFFGIGDWFYKNVTELSGGQKQLLNLASVMVMQPEILILDEPTSMLDPIASQEFLENVYKINRELGITVILSEHRLEKAFCFSDRVIVMDNGHILADDVPQKVGQILYETGNDMFHALPVQMRVYYSKNSDLPCPVTIRDARKWLEQMPINKDLVFEDKPCERNNPVLCLSDVWFRYQKNSPDILKGLSLSVNDGEMFAIVGSNGSGKTTMLNVIAGLEKQYRGKVTVANNKKIAVLPQNPQSLFVKNTTLLDLYEILDCTKLTKAQKDFEVQKVIEFCELFDVLNRHPYDLSGGEQQKAALAKVLLTKPDILLLDEPTKGLDVHFKAGLAKILKGLQNNGVTVLMVSHDIEFCAKYTDCCGMFFDGIITSKGTPRAFFSGKSFYTTSANKMSRNIIDNAVLDRDIINAIGGTLKAKTSDITPALVSDINKEKTDIKKPKKVTVKNILLGSTFVIAFLLMQIFLIGENQSFLNYLYQTIGIVFVGIALRFLFPQKKTRLEKIKTKTHNRKLPKRTFLVIIMVILFIPLTIFTGVYFLGDRKYYFISLLIILETMLPFALIFEGRKPKAREIVIISVLCGIAVAGRCAFAMLPQFKPVVALVIISGVCFGGETGFLVGAITGFVSNFFFGQTPLTPWQMFAFGIIGLLAGVLFEKRILLKTKIHLCIFGFLATLIIYGGIMNSASVIVSQMYPTKEMIITAFAAGFVFDLIHAISTAFFLFFITEPMIDKLDRIKVKYGLVE